MDYYFELAAKTAKKSCMKTKYGAVIVGNKKVGNKIESIAYNEHKAHKQPLNSCILCG